MRDAPARTGAALAEFCGTAFLVAVVVGSGIAAERLSPDDVGLQLLENAAATAAGLVALILAFGPVSGAHFNPRRDLADALFGGLDRRDLPVYVAAQVGGAVTGAVVANLMFELDAVSWSTHPSGGGLWLGEVVATSDCSSSSSASSGPGGPRAAPFAVGAYIGAAYFFTSSTSFANPAVTVGRAFTDTFAGIDPSSVPAFVVFQLVGAALAVVADPHPLPRRRRRRRRRRRPPHGGSDVTDRLEILVVCTHNAGRSVAARVLLDHHGNGRVVVRSAGSAPGRPDQPRGRAGILTERGLDVSKEFPKPLTDDAARAADIIITMGCGDACPVYPGKRYLDWELADPAGRPSTRCGPIVDEIERKVVELLDELDVLPDDHDHQ